MNKRSSYTGTGTRIFDFNISAFESIAIEMFQFQYANNGIYRQFAEALGVDAAGVKALEQIPFLPVNFFKTHSIQTTTFEPQMIFESSGTTQTINSKHAVKDISLYRESFLKGFAQFYGDPEDYCIIGLLPSYLERRHSSLVTMVDELTRLSKHSKSGFYLNEHDQLARTLRELEKDAQKTLLIGVTFALLDFAEEHPMPLKHTIVMETGGMKGRKTEMTRQEVHAQLKEAFHLPYIHSEYGMTELLSQAYSKRDGIFHCPKWMRVLLRNEDDPLEIISAPGTDSRSGVINIIDLANMYSCSFIATDDAGRLYPDGSFEILGRIDSSDIRGCSLMAV
ncbi:acyl transferase [Agriterribacter sp.]|uniref:LuxE/PaaK family acyltransferase n=1 Tax=Agriterribacter sp. TaxID=2821509 RepID=UPI002CC3EAA1|nr:acyl transferase [Agriterribacter sp.]HRP55695.1 acyl transferase [Agriterribacter sp.]